MEFEKLKKVLLLARKELKNIRQELHKLKAIHEKDVNNVKSLLLQPPEGVNPVCKPNEKLDTPEIACKMYPIGYIESCFKQKNGIPRQSGLCPFSTARLTISESVFPNPKYSLVGLEEYSYVWILFIFHKNGDYKFRKAKVHPPRLNGASVGVYSTRSPHRPNAIGLSLTKLEKIEGSTLYLSGVDLLDCTPVLDIKPFIPQYDIPNQNLIFSENILVKDDKYINSSKILDQNLSKTEEKVLHKNERCSIYPCDLCNVASKSETKERFSFPELENCCTCYKESSSLHLDEKKIMDFRSLPETQIIQNISLNGIMKSESSKGTFGIVSKNEMPNKDTKTSNCQIASWVEAASLTPLNVIFTERAESDLQKFHHKQIHDGTETCSFCLEFLLSVQARSAIIDILKNDPRSAYRRKKCSDRLYYFAIDTMHVTCWFDDYANLVEILRVLSVHTTAHNKSSNFEVKEP